MSEIAVREQVTDLSIDVNQTMFTQKQIVALQHLGVESASNADLAVFFHQAVRTGLDPFARQIYMIQRQGKQTIQTGIDGFRLVARRATDRAAGTFGYEDTQWCGEDGVWRDVWLSSDAPAAARVTVIRDGQRYPSVALYSEYVGRKTNGAITAMWSGKPALMLAKCAEALALRKAFPQDLSGIYTSDEMQAGTPDATTSDQDSGRASGADRMRGFLGSSTEPVEEQAKPDEGQPDPITPAQVKKLAVAMNGMSRDDALDYVARAIGRTVESRNDLSKSEASKVIDELVASADVVEAEVVEDDADQVWNEIIEVGTRLGMSGADLNVDFAQVMGGLEAKSATAGELRVYLDKLGSAVSA